MAADPGYRLLDLYLDDYASAGAAAAQAGSLGAAAKQHGTGGVVIAFAEVLEPAQHARDASQSFRCCGDRWPGGNPPSRPPPSTPPMVAEL
jgi:hypothetical protein